MTFLRRVVVDNFQSHDHTELDLGSGLNVIVGPSDYGKSALVRALRWLFYNEPKGANFIRVGARTCRVLVEFDDGTKILRLRDTRGKNRYVLQRPDEEEKTFEGFGGEIPQEIVLASGLRKVLIDERNRVELNFGAQLEGPFLLTENGAVRAKVIGQLGGVHILDWAQKSVGTDLRRLRDEENQRGANLKSLEEALQAYDHLPQLEARIRHLEEATARAEAIAVTIEVLEELQNQWNELENALKRVEKALEELAFLGETEERLRELEALTQEYQELVALSAELQETRSQLEKIEEIIGKTDSVSTAEAQAGKLEALAGQLSGLSQITQEINAVTAPLNRVAGIIARTAMLEQVEEKLSQISDSVQELYLYQEMWKAWQDHGREYQGVITAVERYQMDFEKYLADFRRILVKLGKCPVCFGELTQEAVARVLAEYQ
ncbi:MAG: AAA family ATPase [Bacillota bacterium]|nr:AAA family ATPase [Bacillota bacterium]